VDAQSSEVVGDLPAGHVLIAPAEERREVGAEVAVGESVGQQPERAQGREQGLDALVSEAQAPDAGPGRGDDGLVMAVIAAAPAAGSWLIFWTPGPVGLHSLFSGFLR
jgi:hypothetical protein